MYTPVCENSVQSESVSPVDSSGEIGVMYWMALAMWL